MKRFLFLLTAICLLTAVSHASPPGSPPLTTQHSPIASYQKVQQVYTSQIGVSEVPEGSNWGPQISKYLASVKIYTPAAWCAAFVHWCNATAGVKDRITAWSPTAHNPQNLVYYQGKFLQPPRPADVCTIYFPNLKRIAHTYFFDAGLNKSIYRSVEGNTNKAGSREGTVVMVKYRSYKATYSISRWT